MTRKQALRILDANFNRTREGLRVCEEIARFVLEDAPLTARLKRSRHAVTSLLKKLPAAYAELAAARDSAGDVGRGASKLERGRKDASELFLANSERAKESLRVLEETVKWVAPRLAPAFKKVRFQVYDIEKGALRRLETVRHRRPRRGGR